MIRIKPAALSIRTVRSLAGGLEALARPLRRWLGHFWILIPAALVGLGDWGVVYHFFEPRFRYHIRPAVEYILEHRRPEEPIYALKPEEFLAYWPGHRAEEGIILTREKLPQPIDEDRFWIVTSFPPRRSVHPDHRPPEAEFAPIDQFIGLGGAAVLYERNLPNGPGGLPASAAQENPPLR